MANKVADGGPQPMDIGGVGDHKGKGKSGKGGKESQKGKGKENKSLRKAGKTGKGTMEKVKVPKEKMTREKVKVKARTKASPTRKEKDNRTTRMLESNAKTVASTGILRRIAG